MHQNISVVVFTFNEIRRLPLLYENLKGFASIYVFDGGSTDGTKEFCEKNNVHFFLRPKILSNSFNVLLKDDFQFAFDSVPTDYVLIANCSHFYPSQLLRCLSSIADEDSFSAVYHDILIYRYGKLIHQPFFRRRASACNFYKKSSVDFSETILHDPAPVRVSSDEAKHLKPVNELSIHLFHDEDCYSLNQKHIKYAEIEAMEMYESSPRPSYVGFYGLLIRPLFKFIYHYIRSGAIIRGVPGLIYSISLLELECNKAIFLWEIQHQTGKEKARTLNDRLRSEKIKMSNF
jgi:glycosyltransferase involved in cell wall biosynthesis